MCECCGGDCSLCGGYRHIDLPEPITKVYVREVVDKDGCRLEEMIVNDKWKIIATGDPSKPFRREDMDEQELTKDFPMAMISRLEDIGRVKEKLLTILKDNVFKNLSKHNPYWDSEHETAADKLDDCRMKFGYIHDQLWDIVSVITGDEE